MSVSASDDDGDDVSLSVDGPEFVALSDAGDGTGTLDIAPQDGDAGTYTVTVTTDDGQDTATESFQLTVEEQSSGGELTIEEAVASYGDGDDSKIEFQEIQQAINWWQTDSEVPNTGGQTIDFQQIQQLINLWQTDATVGDGDDNQAPSASFTYSPDSPEAGQEVSFDASGSSDDSAVASYAWDFDADGETDATGAQATHTFDAAGDYDVTLTVTDDDGATDSTTQTVSVSEGSDDSDEDDSDDGDDGDDSDEDDSDDSNKDDSNEQSGEDCSPEEKGSLDSDGDGLTDAEEKELGTDPYDADTDGDCVSDGDEVEAGTDPLCSTCC